MSTDRVVSLQSYFSSPTQELRPIRTSLNGDNSWLISFPRPVAERESSGKAYYHAVHDPWLQGSASVLSTWLVNIDLAAPASITGGDDVEAVVRDIENAAAVAGCLPPKDSTYSEDSSLVDAIFINCPEVDHLHKPTLSTFNSRIPVFAAPLASTILQEWGYFDSVITIKELEAEDGNWMTLHPGAPMPAWLTFFHMKGPHRLTLATAMIWSPVPDTHEALLYSPHGIETEQPTVRTLLYKATPNIEVLAILHGLKESWAYGWMTTFGVQCGLPLYREAKAKYWVLSHNSPLQYSGLIMKGIWEVFRTMEWGLGQENQKGHPGVERGKVNFVEVENGTFTVLA
jgi:hypothetical protein